MPKLAIQGGPKVVEKIGRNEHYHEVVSKDEIIASLRKLENEFANYCGAKYAIACSWGTSALDRGMAAAGVGPGDEVIVPAFTFPPSVNCVLHFNGIPVFADIDPRTFTLDVEDVKTKITDRTKAIIPVDIYGHPADIHELMSIAEKRGITIVEDACQATGAEINGETIGSIAHITTFSFSGKPLFSSSGGIMTANDELLYERAQIAGAHPSLLTQLTNQELRDLYASTLGYGFKSRIDPHAAKIALNILGQLNDMNNGRITNAQYLTEVLSDVEGITPPYVKPGYKHVYHYYSCLIDEHKLDIDRDRFVHALRAEGVPAITYVDGANYHYFPGGRYISAGPIHRRPIFQELNLYGKGCPFQCPHASYKPDYSTISLPVTDQIVAREFNIPQPALMYPNNKKTMRLYADAIEKVVENIDEVRDLDLDKLQ